MIVDKLQKILEGFMDLTSRADSVSASGKFFNPELRKTITAFLNELNGVLSEQVQHKQKTSGKNPTTPPVTNSKK